MNGVKVLLRLEILNIFFFKGKDIDDKVFNNYLDQFGMKINDILYFNDFVFLIKKNKKLNDSDDGKKLKHVKSKSVIASHDSCKGLYVDADMQEVFSDMKE